MDNYHKDFVANMHSNFLQGKKDRDLLYCPNHILGNLFLYLYGAMGGLVL